MIPGFDSPLPGYVVTRVYQPSVEEVARIDEIQSIRRSAQERLDTLHQKVLDCTRLMEGFLTEVKWRENWNDGDVVVYEAKKHLLLALERVDEKT